MLTDGFGREVSGIRISLTDRCNFDCVYCHNEGLGDTRGPMEPQEDELSATAVRRIVEVAHEFGVRSVKFTGGEPLLREDLPEIIAGVPDDMEVSLTTNGTFLPGRADGLVEAGLDRVNVSQDAMDADAFADVTQTGAFDRVLEGVDAALAAGLAPVKLNMVVFEATAGYVPQMVDHVAENPGLRLQLIEYMPELTGNPEWAIDIQRVHDWLESQATTVERREMHGRRRYWITPEDQAEQSARDTVATDGGAVDDTVAIGETTGSDGNATDRTAADGEEQIDDTTAGMVEIVDPVENESFCANCHRVRVTHDGKLKGCLNRTDDLRSMGDCTKPEIRKAFRETVHERVPYYGEYLIRDENGEWVVNEKYV